MLHSQLVLDGGELHLEDCSFVNSSAEEGGALRVSGGGALTAESVSFEACQATRGVPSPTPHPHPHPHPHPNLNPDPDPDLSQATRGGAVHVSAGGAAVFSGCTFARSTAAAVRGGGAVWVGATARVVLRERTRLHGNSAAGALESIHVAEVRLRGRVSLLTLTLILTLTLALALILPLTPSPSPSHPHPHTLTRTRTQAT